MIDPTAPGTALPPIGALAVRCTPHHRAVAAQHGETLRTTPLILHAAGARAGSAAAAPASVLPVATAYTGQFARLVFFHGRPDDALGLDDPGMAIEHFLFNATDAAGVLVSAPTLGTRGVRVFDEHGELRRDELVSLSASPVLLAIPPRGYARF
jgi:hypothetical protein